MALKHSNIDKTPKKGDKEKAVKQVRKAGNVIQTDDTRPPTMQERQVTSSGGEPFSVAQVPMGPTGQWHVLDSRRTDNAAAAIFPAKDLAQEYCDRQNAKAKAKWEEKRNPNRMRNQED